MVDLVLGRKWCPCGEDNNESAHHCWNCGTVREVSPTTPTKNQTPIIVDYSALSYQNQIEELFLRTYLYFSWFPNTPIVATRPHGVIPGVWEEVELRKWQWDGMCYWLAA